MGYEEVRKTYFDIIELEKEIEDLSSEITNKRECIDELKSDLAFLDSPFSEDDLKAFRQVKADWDREVTDFSLYKKDPSKFWTIPIQARQQAQNVHAIRG